MKAPRYLALVLAALPAFAGNTDAWLDQVDEALTVGAAHDTFRLRLSGTLDLEDYHFQDPAPGLIFADGPALFNPRLTLYLDGQWGAHVYLFAEARADRAFDPTDEGTQLRLEEYAVRITPWLGRHFSVQLGKFAIVIGNWVGRHDSWNNPFVTAPLPYENLTGVWDAAAPRSVDTLLAWAHVTPASASGYGYGDKYRRLPIIWGPSYASGASVSGGTDRLDYAVEVKNTTPSSRPEVWDATQTQWQHPTVSGRLGFRPDEMWNLGVSASVGSYLRPMAQSSLAPGTSLADYRELLVGQDLAFAWHHVQFWSEVYGARFAIPRVGNADTAAYYLEVKYKFTPQFFGALRWNQQFFGTLPEPGGAAVRWGRNVWRLDLAPGYRLSAHAQLKLQYSLQHEEAPAARLEHLGALQFTVRF